MSFFSNSSGYIINGGIFTINTGSLPTQAAADGTQAPEERKDRDSCESDDCAQDDDLRKCRCKNLDGLRIVKADEIDLRRELIRGMGYRIHSAFHHGRGIVAVKVFEGRRAKQDWTVEMAFYKEFLHSNLLKIEGVSDERSKSHFILFGGISSEQKMESLIAKGLQTDLNMSVRVSLKVVRGIAAGLSHIKSQNIPMYPGIMSNTLNWKNVNIFIGYNDEPIISFHPSSIVHENGPVLQTFDNEIDDCGVEALSGICQEVFSGANSILYDDSPEREFDVYDKEGFPKAILEDEVGIFESNVSESEDISKPSNLTGKPKSCPRREVRWLDLRAKNQSLESIIRNFEDCLDRSPSSSSNSPLRHITSPMDNKLRQNIHQCPGYLREEITLAPDVSKSIIISHAFPSQSEVCSICGQIVQYIEASINDVEMQEAPDDSGSDLESNNVDSFEEAQTQIPEENPHRLPRFQSSGIPFSRGLGLPLTASLRPESYLKKWESRMYHIYIELTQASNQDMMSAEEMEHIFMVFKNFLDARNLFRQKIKDGDCTWYKGKNFAKDFSDSCHRSMTCGNNMITQLRSRKISR